MYDKMLLRIIYYIRQSREISIIDLFEKIFRYDHSNTGSLVVYFVECIYDLYDSDFTKITIKTKKGCERFEWNEELIFEVLEFAFNNLESYRPFDIMISLTEKFNKTQRTIGFSITDEIRQMQEEFNREYLLGEVNPNIKSNVFVIMPFSEQLKPVYEDHITAVCKKLKYECKRADLIGAPNVILNDIWSSIYNANIIICDCTGKNPNVFYELGLAHAIGKRVITITQNSEDIPFDIKSTRYIKYEYNPRGMNKFEVELEEFMSSHAFNNIENL